MRVCIIGNSHMGALVKAIKDQPQSLDAEILAYPGNKLLKGLKINKDYELVSEDEDLAYLIQKSDIKALSNYQVVIIYGCQLRSARKGENWFEHIKKYDYQYSKAFTRENTGDFIKATDHYEFLASNQHAIINMRDTRFISIPCPMPNESSPLYSRTELAIETVQNSAIMMNDIIGLLGVEFMDTPMNLVNSEGVATKREYKNSRENDFSHLNTEGGKLVLKEIKSYLNL